MPVRIIHAADLHMDSSFYSLPRDKSAQRRREQRQMLDRLAAAVEEEGAQILLLSGDLFDSSSSYWETSDALTKMFSRIKAHVFIAPGNHDYYTSHSPYAFMELPENVHIFKTPSIRCYELPELGCRVWGAGFSASVCDPILRGFSAAGSDMVDIMVLHGDMDGDRYNPISEEDIAASGLDYLALGHIHSFSGIKRAGNTYYAYPGCIEGRGFDETGPKGVIAGTVSKGSCDLRFLPIPGRRYILCSVDMTGREDPVAAAVETAGEGHPDDIARIVFTGEFAGTVDQEAVIRSLEDRYFHLTVRDETVPPRSLWEGVDEDSLTGLFLSSLKAGFESAGDEETRQRCLLAARYGIAALEGREEWRP